LRLRAGFADRNERNRKSLRPTFRSHVPANVHRQTPSPFFSPSFVPFGHHRSITHSLRLRAGLAERNERSRKSLRPTFRSHVPANVHRQTPSPFFAFFRSFRPPPLHHLLFAAASWLCPKERKKPFSRARLSPGCRSLVLCGRNRNRDPVWTGSLDA